MSYGPDTIYKALNGREATYGGTYTYRRNTWTRHIDPADLEPCEVGYHVAKGAQVLGWLAPDLWVAEICPDHEPIDHGDKLVTCKTRIVAKVDTWNDTTARLFAADCAEAALLGERANGREPDERSWAAMEAARQYARGEIGAAARDAASAAASAAARAAARDAARAAAWAAARAAAWAAARAAASAAAWAAASDAAGDAVGRISRAAASDAAWDAARDVQYARLTLYLNGQDLPPVQPLYGTTR